MPPAPLATAEPAASSIAALMPPERGAASSWRRLVTWQGIAIGLLLLLGELPLLLKFFADLWSRPQYQFYPVALIAAGYIFWERVREMPADRVRRGSPGVTAALLALSWFILALGLAYLRWMAPVSTWILLAAAVWWIGGRGLARAVLPAGILLLIIIPPPAHFDDALGNQLRMLAVHASSRVLDLISLPHVITGTVIEIPGNRLLVEEACSGINSLMSVLAFTILYGIWQRRGAWFTAALAVAAAGFVLCANIVRITVGAILVQYWKIDILTGTSHELLGMMLFAVSLGLVISFDRFLLMIWPRRELGSAPARNARAAAATSNGATSNGALLWWPAAIAFVALGAVMQMRMGHLWAQSKLAAGAKFSMPEKLAGWELSRGEGTINGRPETDSAKSNVWVYHSGPLVALVALNYPFDGYHDATICYRSSGWTINSNAHVAPGGSPREGYASVQMAKPPMTSGQLFFAQFDEHAMSPPVTAQVPPGTGRLRTALTLSREKAQAPPTYQIQTLAIGYSPISQGQEASLRALFLAARRELSREVVSQLEGGR